MSAERIVDEWLAWLASSSESAQSPRTRRAQINQVAKRFDLATVTEADLIGLLASSGWTKSTRHAYRSAWRSFFGYAVGRGWRDDNPAAGLPTIRVPLGVPKPTKDDAIEFGLVVADERVALMVLLAAYEGLRRNEIATLRLDAITPFGLRITGKGGRTRLLPIHPRAEAPLRAWVERQPGPWVFPSPRDVTAHISADYVGRHLKEVTGEVGHHLRHRFATAVYNGSGHDLRTTQELLGHSSPQTTAIYTLVTEDAKAAAVRSIA